jgi:ribosome-binding factor A
MSNTFTKRQLQVGELVKKTLNTSIISGNFHDRDLKNAFISVNEVRISPDLKNAKAFVTIINEEHPHKAIKALNKAVPFFKKEFSEKLHLKFIPNIVFLKDETEEEAYRINALLKEIQE